ncbi:generic methyltransferase [Aureimonas endophytica]|uniref:Generic methyltransferase n=1 Tax=Aureimonas endophytica TaxID=2027858 RepID=A0A916ZI51_9HYPH|nr:methyltransferase domain-containing protein [Aureimonas endophytica]GGD99089.1 generic methyltransferase [Aureimonas endophytica]
MTSRRVLNVGSGPPGLSRLHPVFRDPSWRAVRLDIDPGVAPDIVGDMADLRALVPDMSFDAVWSSHNLEHLPAHRVGAALGEWRRVLAPTGFALLTCPDVEAVARLVLDKGLDATAYESPAGPITARDMLWGHGASIAGGHGFMAHRTGFTAESLGEAALAAGFAEIRVARRHFALWALCLMPRAVLGVIETLFETAGEGALFSAPDDEATPDPAWAAP